jgi:large conductance mechanosensitive channel
MIKEFRDFINKGNVIDLAVAVVLGGAFGAVVKSFTDDVLMQLIAAIGGQPDFTALTIDVGDSTIRYGSFLTSITAFLIVAWAMFLVVKSLNTMQGLRSKGDVEEAPAGPTELEVLLEIKELLAKRG